MMKTILYKFISFFLLLLIVSACDTDVIPKGQISSETFWQTEEDANRALMGCYETIDNMGYENAYFDGYSDIVYCQYPWESNATRIAAGNIDDNMNAGYSFKGIRRYNYFLDNVDKADINVQTKAKLKAEVRVMRALNYFNLANTFGPVPLFTKYITKSEEAQVAPTNEQEVIQFVIKELEESIPDLPTVPNQKSRIGKAFAYAIKARVHLFYKDYQAAADASKQIMNMGQYSLFKVNTLTSEDKMDDYSNLVDFIDDAAKNKFLLGLRSYEKLFYEENKENVEVIFNREYIKDRYNYIGRYFLPTNTYAGWASITPTSNLVVQYWSKDGGVFNSPTQAVRTANFEKGKTTSDWEDYLEEFKNRDTRLYASILFPQAPWYAAKGTDLFTWDVGNNNTSKTGYNFRKMVDPTDPSYVKAGIQDYPAIRYAEVLLTFAEAQNEMSGPSLEVYEALDKIRDRVGMPLIDRTTYNTQDKLRNLIRTERCIELAGEGFRWNDIRRWGISAQVIKDVYAINGSIAQKRVWEPRFVRLPYPISAVDRNPKLKDAQKAKGY